MAALRGGLVRWGLAAALLAVAFDPRTPYLLALRGGITALLLGAAAIGIGLVVWASRSRRLGRLEAGALGFACALAGTLALGDAVVFRAQRQAVLAADVEAHRLGQRFIVGYRDFAEVARLAERGLIGGVYLTRRNVGNRSAAEIRAEVDALQALRRGAGLPPLLVAADQEGGSVAHLSPPLPAMPALAELVIAAEAAGEDGVSLAERAHAYGAWQGRELAALGVNLNFGPVVDLRPQDGGPRLDTHTLIARRAIAADPGTVAAVAAAYGEGLASAGVRATLKHFPGLGGVAVDTHHFTARLDTPPEHLAARDWQPFRDAARADGAIMLGHVVLPGLDAERPASLSPAVVRLLRREWGYRGLLITDDLNMGAVYHRGVCRAAVEALSAGVDMVLISYDPDQYYRAMHCAMAALRAGRIAAPGGAQPGAAALPVALRRPAGRGDAGG
ncbi:glycoside hydrolase family 3 protein [Azoarcus sp. TTM-91]|uniref:glycoside hydrolase family 3 protein n=1 Tax=Azoarcus sp. TTM-91 TaxID=2691581 RepID=UPI00145DC520|nr:glycoside hydrolase family 3 protein [Azoarcus sp. TTM-91]NMG36875.1 glycoside hydrolase family 3 protein [Azoarcus sp. TTM-91]